MKSITVDDQIYNKMKAIAARRGVTMVEVMRKELPQVVENMQTAEYKTMTHSKRSIVKEEAVSAGPVVEAKSERRALLDLVLDMIEIDVEAPENHTYVQETFKKIGDKIENYQWANFNIDQQREALKRQKEHLDVLIKRCNYAEEALGNYVKQVLETMGVKEMRGENYSKIYISNYKSVEIYNETLLPNWAKREVTNVVVNKAQIAEHLKSNQEVPGARLITSSYGYVSKPKKKALTGE